MARGGGLREAAKEVAQHASAVARLQAELAKSDVATTYGLAFGAALFAAFTFALFTTLLVVALAIPLPAWLACLIVMVVYGAVAALLAMLFRKRKQSTVAKDQARITAAALLGRATPPAPAPELRSAVASTPPPPGGRGTP